MDTGPSKERSPFGPPLNPLETSLQDFSEGENPLPQVYPCQQSHPRQNSAALRRTRIEEYPSPAHSVFRSDPESCLTDSENCLRESAIRDSLSSDGGYSPPAWRRLGNGDRSSGFWRSGDNILGPLPPAQINTRRTPIGGFGGRQAVGVGHRYNDGRANLDAYDGSNEPGNSENDEVLARAIRTRLPGSASPEKGRSPEPEASGQIIRAGVRMKSIDGVFREEIERRDSPFVKRETTEPPSSRLANDNCEFQPTNVDSVGEMEY